MSIRRDTRMLNAQGQPAFIIDYKDEYGRRKQIRTDACTLKDAQRIERDILTKIDKARSLGVSKQALTGMTFGQFVDGTYMPNVKETVRTSTYDRYEVVVGHLKSFIGSMGLASITPETIDAYFVKAKKETTRRGGPPGAGELYARMSRLGAVLEMATRRRLIQFNPVRCVERRQYKPDERHLISEDEERRLLKEAPAWLKPFIVIGLNGGMRVSEITAMTWENLKGGFIYVPTSKNGEARYVPINAAVEGVLSDIPRRVEEGKAIPWVFWNEPVKKPYCVSSVSKGFSRIAENLDIPATFHCTRHTFITRMQDKGVHPAKLMEITGHKTAAMLGHYTHLQASHLKGLTDVLCTESAEPVQNAAGGR